MPTPIAPRIILAQNARVELQTLVRAHTTPQSLALRARMILRAAALDRPTNRTIGRELRHGAKIIPRFIGACIIVTVQQHFSASILHCRQSLAD